MSKVKVICKEYGEYQGFVVASIFREGRWLYKVSLSEDRKSDDTFDNWIPENCLEEIR